MGACACAHMHMVCVCVCVCVLRTHLLLLPCTALPQVLQLQETLIVSLLQTLQVPHSVCHHRSQRTLFYLVLQGHVRVQRVIKFVGSV